MSTYRILRQSDLQTTISPPFFQDGFLFNTPDHLRQQSEQDSRTVTALNQLTNQTEARCTFFIESNGAISPVAAPFGSLEFIDSLPDSVLSGLIDALIDEAYATGAPTLRLVNYPHCYAPEQAQRLTEQLLQRGFRVVAADQNFFLPITQYSLRKHHRRIGTATAAQVSAGRFSVPALVPPGCRYGYLVPPGNPSATGLPAYAYPRPAETSAPGFPESIFSFRRRRWPGISRFNSNGAGAGRHSVYVSASLQPQLPYLQPHGDADGWSVWLLPATKHTAARSGGVARRRSSAKTQPDALQTKPRCAGITQADLRESVLNTELGRTHGGYGEE